MRPLKLSSFDNLHLLAHPGAVNPELNKEIDQIACCPVKRQPRSVTPQRKSHNDGRNKRKQPSLGRIHPWRRRYELSEAHRDDDEDGPSPSSRYRVRKQDAAPGRAVWL